MAEYYVVRDKNTGLYFRGKGVNRWGKYYNQASIYRIRANAENTVKEVSWRGEQAEVVPIRIFENTADIEEVRHGYWIDKPTGRYCHNGSYCSVCEEKSGIGGIESNRHKPYCPNCGTKMDGTPKERGGEK